MAATTSADTGGGGPPRRRKRGGGDDGGEGASVQAVAHLLAKTYEIERRVFENRKSEDGVYDLNRFSTVFGRTGGGDDEGFGVVRDRGAAEADGGRRARQDAKRAALWLKLAAELIQKRIDPEDYVRRQFTAAPAGGDAPLPESIASATGQGNYEAGRATAYRECELSFKLQTGTCKTEMACAFGGGRRSSEDTWAHVLGGENLELSPLFRYCMAAAIAQQPGLIAASRARFRELAERFRLVASMQYVTDAENYDLIWRDDTGRSFIPEHFPNQARETYDAYYRGCT